MNNKSNYQNLKTFAKNVKKKKIKKRKTRKIDKEKIINYNIKKKKKSKKFKFAKTNKNNYYKKQLKRNKTFKKYNETKHYNFNGKDFDFDTEYLIDLIQDGGGCGVPKIKSIERKLNKIKSKDFMKSIAKLSSSFFEQDLLFTNIKKKYRDHLNTLRKHFNLELSLNPDYKDLINYKKQNLKVELNQVELNRTVLENDIKINTETMEKKRIKEIKYYNKWDKSYKKHKKTLLKIQNKPKLIEKINKVRMQYEQYIQYRNNPNFTSPESDPGSEVKSILKKGRKCEKKWTKIIDFYKETFQSNNEILNKCLNIVSKNQQINIFFEKEKEKHLTDESKLSEWRTDTKNIYEKIGKLLSNDTTNALNSISNKIKLLEKIKDNIERVKEIITTTGINQLKNVYIKSLDILISFLSIIIDNMKAIKEDLKRLFDGFIELWDYKYMKKILATIINLHIENIHRIIIVFFFFENIDKEQQLELLTKTVTTTQIPLQTSVDLKGAIKTGNTSLIRRVNQPTQPYLEGTPNVGYMSSAQQSPLIQQRQHIQAGGTNDSHVLFLDFLKTVSPEVHSYYSENYKFKKHNESHGIELPTKSGQKPKNTNVFDPLLTYSDVTMKHIKRVEAFIAKIN